MKETNKQALQKTSREFLFVFAAIMALILAVWGVLYIIDNLGRLFDWLSMLLGNRTLIAAVLLMVLSGVFYFRYRINSIDIENGESKEVKEWFGASEIPTTILPGRYNIILTNKTIIWNTTEHVFEANRSEVTEWFRKS